MTVGGQRRLAAVWFADVVGYTALASTNEELTTVNDEMSARNTELNRINNDLVNLQTSTRLAVLLLGRDLAVRGYARRGLTSSNP